MFPIAVASLLIIALAAFAWTAQRRTRLLLSLRGQDSRMDHIAKRVIGDLIYAFGQWRFLLRDRVSGVLHIFIFWGFMVVSLRTIQLFALGMSNTIPLLIPGTFGHMYSFSREILQVLVLVGVAGMSLRRAVFRPKRLTLSGEAQLILAAIATLMITDFLLEAAYLAQHQIVDPWTPVSMFIANTLFAHTSTEALQTWFTANYFSHIIVILVFLNYLPYGKHFHIITGIPNVFLRKTKPYGMLANINLEDPNATSYGVDKITDFSWKQGLDMYTCTECGRCTSQCPASNSGKMLNPKLFLVALRDHLYANDAQALAERSKPAADGSLPQLVPQTVDPQILWDCTTCRACEEACPVFIEYVDKIVDMRRNLVLMRGEFPAEAQKTLRNIEVNSNPWGINNDTRADWCKGLNVPIMADGAQVEYLYWVGCAGAFDARSKQVAVALVKLMQKAGVSFGILGTEEQCTGDSARRIGNEYLFQMKAKQNIELLNKYGVKKIITTCPHCFNTLKNEYGEFGGHYEVLHHTELLTQLLREKKLVPRESTGDVVFHDSCYLGRYNEVYDAPREVLKHIPGVKLSEAENSRDKGRCCGAGGGRMWMEENTGTARVNHQRFDDLQKTGATTFASGCPFCLTMLTDAAKHTGASEHIHTRDVAEILADAVGV